MVARNLNWNDIRPINNSLNEGFEELVEAYNHMNEKGFEKAKLDKYSTNPDAIRGREQQLISNINIC